MKKKAQILSAAVSLFSQKGFNAVSTAMIAKKAGVAEGLIYYHFERKEAIFVAILEKLLEDYIEEMRRKVEKAESGLDAIEWIVRFHFVFSRKRQREFSVSMRGFPPRFRRYDSPYREIVVSRVDAFFQIIRHCIERGIADGSIRPDVDPGSFAFYMRAVFNGILYEQVSGLYSVPDLTDEILTSFRALLAA